MKQKTKKGKMTDVRYDEKRGTKIYR